MMRCRPFRAFTGRFMMSNVTRNGNYYTGSTAPLLMFVEVLYLYNRLRLIFYIINSTTVQVEFIM